MIVVIDGPAGSGKSSTARAVADILGIEYIDSGALYRAMTVLYLESDKNPGKFFELLDELEVSFKYSDKKFLVFVNGSDITDRIRTREVADMVSQVASMPEVRSYVNNLMHGIVEHGCYIAEGRDLGTVVFPNADLKYYMSAEVDQRVQRRYRELKEQDREITLEEVRENILSRDELDSRRKVDPLRKAEDATEVDTTDLSFEQQVNEISRQVSSLMKAKTP